MIAGRTGTLAIGLVLLATFLLVGAGRIGAQTPGQPAGAQVPGASSPGDKPAGPNEALVKTMERWTAAIGSVRRQLDAGGLTRDRLDQMRRDIEAIIVRARAAQTRAEREAAEIRELAKALGPPPKKGETEGESVAAQRLALNRRIAAAEGREKRAGVIIAAGGRVIELVAERRRQRFARQLGKAGRPMLAAETWRKGLRDLGAIFGSYVRSPAAWWRSDRVAEARSSGALLTGLVIIALAVTAGWLMRVWLLRRFGRDPSTREPTYARRVQAAIAEGTARGLVPALAVSAIWFAFEFERLDEGLFAVVLGAVLIAIVVFTMTRAFARAALSPRFPGWRLTNFASGASTRLSNRVTLVAGLFALDLALGAPAIEIGHTPESQAIYFFIFGLFYCALFLALLRRNLWRTKSEPGVPSEGMPAGPAARRAWPYLLLCVLVGAGALAIPAASLLDYHELSGFIRTRMLLSGLFVALALVLHGLANEVASVAFESDGEVGTRLRAKLGLSEQSASFARFWTVFLVDVVLGITLVFLLLPLWGVPWDEAWLWLGRAFAGFSIGKYRFSLADFFLAILVFFALVALVRVLQRALERKVLPQTRLDIGVRHALRAGLGYVGVTIAALIGISVAGLDLSNLALIAGALSVGIGFGLQNVVNNFVSGLILLVERPIQVGDWVVVEGHEGFVKRISVRSTEITTFQRASVIIPNSKFLENPVQNWTHKDASGRIDIPVGVAYGSDTELVRDTLLEIAKANPKIREIPPPEALFLNFGESSLDFQLRAHTASISDHFRIGSELRFAIDDAFREAGIEIAFPQRDIHIRDLDKPERVRRAIDDGATAPEKKPPARRKPSGKSSPAT